MNRALNVRYYGLAEQVQKGFIRIQYLNTGDMLADYMSKPLTGKGFRRFRDAIMGTKIVPEKQ